MSKRKKKIKKSQGQITDPVAKDTRKPPIERPTAMGMAFRTAGILEVKVANTSLPKQDLTPQTDASGQVGQRQKRIMRPGNVAEKSNLKDQVIVERIKLKPKEEKPEKIKEVASIRRHESDTRPGRTQICSTDEAKSREIVIGIDFGTSCTKIVIRDRELGQAYAVPLESQTTPGFPYFLPSRLFIDSNKVISLISGDTCMKDIKLMLMRSPELVKKIDNNLPESVSSLELVTGYLALTLREARHWFLENHNAVYSGLLIDWSFNIGVPSSSSEFKSHAQIYKKAALAAWWLSAQNGLLDLTLVQEALVKAEESIQQNVPIDDAGLHPELVNSFPEVIAEAVGYARSDMRPTDGTMHLLVDVGAGTMDLAMFVLHRVKDPDTESEIDQYSTLLNDVCRLGALILHEERVNYQYKFLKEKLEGLVSDDFFVSSIPGPNDYIVDQTSKVIDECDRNFKNNCSNRIKTILLNAKRKRNPIAWIWEEGLPVILSGGGSKVPIYRKAIEESQEALGSQVVPFRLIELNKPSRLEAQLLAEDYHRLAVAYGLSHSVLEIGNVLPPEAIEDISISKRKTHYTDNYPGAEMT